MKKVEEYVNKLSQMINVETVNTDNPKDIEKFIKYQNVLANLFPHLFSKFTKYDFDGSFLLELKVDSSLKPICLMSHQDVVPSNGKWDSDPFKAVIKNERLYGRGTLDVKGNFFCIAQAIEELIIEGYEFTRSIYIISSNDEETKSQGVQKIVNHLKQNGITFSFVIDEGGMIVNNVITGKDKVAMVALGEKQFIDVKFSKTLKGGHSSNPGKTSSLIEISKFIIKLNKYRGFAAFFDPTTEELLRSCASSSKGIKKFIFKHAHGFRHLLCSIFKHLSSMTRAMVQTTLCVTRMAGSEEANVIPDTSWAIANIRVSHHDSYEKVINKLLKICKKNNINMEVIDSGYASKISSFKTNQFAYLKTIIKKQFGIETLPYIATGGTDSRYLDSVCENIFRFAPISIDDSQLASIHEANENIDLIALEPAVTFYKTLIKEYTND